MMRRITPGTVGPKIFGPTARLDTETVAGDVRYDGAAAALSSWLVGGLYLDGWAHHRFPELETFFTPWHGALYSGFLAMAALLVITLLRQRAHGYAWQHAMPVGYAASLAGLVLFFIGGAGDMIWHILLGIEVGIEALLSPTHLLLALGGALIITGPLRALWQRASSTAPRFTTLAPALLSLALLVALLTFFTEYLNPFFLPLAGVTRRPDVAEDGQALGIASMIVQTGLLMGSTLLVMRRWTLPPGSLTLLFGVSITLGVFPHGEYRFIPGAVLTGFIADGLVSLTRPTPGRARMVRFVAFTVPAVLYALYFLTLHVTEGIWWTPPLWSGAIIITGVVGLLLSYLLIPPIAPEQADPVRSH